ncbi:Protein phosphatase 2C family protein [Quillaja saponaria]|uniref:Protein phosphatase n=1 Tax=Quillaja saponaria TaxID=32244 RepID=A0AAD7QHZ5_QUISA|nr:Protein phosphatase 2C family protein [Quillaja saponaria]
MTNSPKVEDHDRHSSPSTDSTKPNLKMVLGSHYFPKYNLKKPFGEDAHFICPEKQTLGVADGVGAWAKKGIDGGEYARQLMANSLAAVHNQPTGAVDPKRVLTEGYLNTKEQGSSTACILTLKTQEHLLLATNMGDSGFFLFRNNKLFFRSSVMQHSYNCPYQLKYDSKSDSPELAIDLTIPVMPGDFIVVGTDGLFDNLWPKEIEDILEWATTKLESVEPQHLAWTIGRVAYYNSSNKQKVSPFAEAARVAGRIHVGGKIDDITVVVAHIVSSS